MEIFLHQRAAETGFLKVDPREESRGPSVLSTWARELSVWLEGGEEALDPEKTLAEVRRG